MSVVTVDELKLHLGIKTSTEDERLQQFLDGVEESVWQWTGRERVAGHTPFESVQSTEFYDGNDRQMLVLRRRPVTEVVGVWLDRSGCYGANPSGFPESSKWTYGVDYAPKRLDQSEQNASILMAYAGSIPSWQGQAQRFPAWPRGQGNIKVTYTAGYTNLPLDLITAICNITAEVRKAAPQGAMLESETIGRYSYTLMKSGGKGGSSTEFDQVGQALSTLARYREVNL